MAERASDRLLRLLGLVAYLEGRGAVPVEDVARQFDVSTRQVLADIDTLWVTGTPGYFPYDLIDFDADSYEHGLVRLTEGRSITRPLRLGPREASVLLTALRALRDALGPGLDDERAAVLASATEKLAAATGGAQQDALDVRLAVPGRPEVLATVERALRERRRLHLRYVDAADVVTERDVDPLRLEAGEARSYLLAWCRLVEGERLFRLDRVLAVTPLDEPAEDHAVADRTDFRPSEGDVVTLHLRSRGRWVAESSPTEDVRTLPDGTLELDVRVQHPAWLTRVLLAAAADVLAVRPAGAAREAAAAARAALAAYAAAGLVDDDEGRTNAAPTSGAPTDGQPADGRADAGRD
ncbi:helix-turn-helix transcriptional regulator [Cellulomonas marina]|uniref:Proteasome accessory factor C n=1 Tax=Cellulomonas marina TaxID=988821 RepID=A0A1I0W9D6_9CELL|nr:WYL domain-containing protein [Cellulomonas marina]GIG29082.1 protein pafC [Cellulomonas marina]SFA85365.1 proteasome accessory factor C [Cellulomonas marina]